MLSFFSGTTRIRVLLVSTSCYLFRKPSTALLHLSLDHSRLFHKNFATTMTDTTTSSTKKIVPHYINGQCITPTPTPADIPVTNPATHEVLAYIARGGDDADTTLSAALDAATAAGPDWRRRTYSSRAAILHRFQALVQDQDIMAELTALIVQENGKNVKEAAADIAKGLETVAYACSVANSNGAGNFMKVSSEVTCRDARAPLGVVASIVPL